MESISEVASLLKELTTRFDSLQQDVDSLKAGARRSASKSPAPQGNSEDGRSADSSDPSSDTEHSALEKRRSRRGSRRRQRRRGNKPEHKRRRRARSESGTSRSRSRSPQPHRRKGKSPERGSRRPSRSWADRMSDSEEEEMDYTKGVDFSESETEDQPPVKLVEVSEKTKKFLQDKCTRRVSNAERKELRGHYQLQKRHSWMPS